MFLRKYSCVILKNCGKIYIIHFNHFKCIISGIKHLNVQHLNCCTSVSAFNAFEYIRRSGIARLCINSMFMYAF